MTHRLRVILEVGKKRRVVAGAMDWPGLDRWGTSEDDALEKVLSYAPRYAGVAEVVQRAQNVVAPAGGIRELRPEGAAFAVILDGFTGR